MERKLYGPMEILFLTFRLQGTDLDGEKYTYYDTVEFTRENTDTSKDARLSLIF